MRQTRSEEGGEARTVDAAEIGKRAGGGRKNGK